MRIEHSLRIERPIGDVFLLLVGGEGAATVDVGALVDGWWWRLGRAPAERAEVIEYEPPRAFALRSLADPRTQVRFTLEAECGATRVTQVAELDPAGLFGLAAFGPALGSKGEPG